MIITRTPLRVSFFGGGSDFSYYYQTYGGAVLSSSINKFIYINLNKKFEGGFRISYSENEYVESVDQIKHKIIRESLSSRNIKENLEIVTVADIPSKGTGLGSSSAFTVGLLNALNTFYEQKTCKYDLANESSSVEIFLCNEPIGKQDHFASCFGGFNLIKFSQDGSTQVTPVINKDGIIKKLEENLLIFYTGLSRNASEILRKQTNLIQNDSKRLEILHKMVNLVYVASECLSDSNLSAFGEILDLNWSYKKELSDEISNSMIDDCYQKAKKNGAIGGKILGAGAGGFLLLYAPKEKHPNIIRALSNLKVLDFKFENQGSVVIYKD